MALTYGEFGGAGRVMGIKRITKEKENKSCFKNDGNYAL